MKFVQSSRRGSPFFAEAVDNCLSKKSTTSGECGFDFIDEESKPSRKTSGSLQFSSCYFYRRFWLFVRKDIVIARCAPKGRLRLYFSSFVRPSIRSDKDFWNQELPSSECRISTCAKRNNASNTTMDNA